MKINKEMWLVVSLAIVIIILLGVFIFVPVPRNFDQKMPGPTGTQGLTIFSLRPNQEVSSPLKITGEVAGDGWSGFEDQVGTVKLLDGRYLDGKGVEMASGVLKATTEWTTLPTSFDATLNFETNGAKSGVLVFYNENPSGDPARDKAFTLPVTFK